MRKTFIQDHCNEGEKSSSAQNTTTTGEGIVKEQGEGVRGWKVTKETPKVEGFLLNRPNGVLHSR